MNLAGSIDNLYNNANDKIILCTIAFAILSSVILICTYFYYVPLGVDGGWYSYPAYELSKGEDPNTNLLSIQELQEKKGINAKFGFSTRKLRLIPVSLWIKLMGYNITRLKYYSLLELCILFILVFYTFLIHASTVKKALLFWCIFITDSLIISLGASDVRPDLAVAIVSILSFIAISKIIKSIDILWLFVGGISCFFLFSFHITAALPLSFIVFYTLCAIIVFWRSLNLAQIYSLVIIILSGVLGVLYSKSIVNIFLPTKIIPNLKSPPLFDKISTLISSGFVPIISKEFHRWTEYFFISNYANFLLLITGIMLCIYYSYLLITSQPRTVRISKPTKEFLITFFSCFVSIIVLALMDPHDTPHHAVPLIPFFILLILKVVELMGKEEKKAIFFILFIIMLSSSLKIALSAKITINSIQNNYSNTKVEEALQNEFSPEKKYLIICPTELWPYFPENSNITIVDKRYLKKRNELSGYINQVDYIVLNNELHTTGIKDTIYKWFPEIKHKTIARIGNSNSLDAFEIVKLYYD